METIGQGAQPPCIEGYTFDPTPADDAGVVRETAPARSGSDAELQAMALAQRADFVGRVIRIDGSRDSSAHK